jgi:hypothetical protein
MARILVLSDDGKATLADERHVSPVRLESTVESRNLLERLAWAVAAAEERDGEPARGRRARRPSRARSGARPGAGAMRDAAVTSGFGRSFD